MGLEVVWWRFAKYRNLDLTLDELKSTTHVVVLFQKAQVGSKVLSEAISEASGEETAAKKTGRSPDRVCENQTSQ